jgi:hypothetical protein
MKDVYLKKTKFLETKTDPNEKPKLQFPGNFLV